MVNAGPEHWVADAAIRALQAWVTKGQAPAVGTPLMLTAGGDGVVQDASGNTLGGVRTPAVDVPIAAYSGQPAGNAGLVCSLFGQTTPFPAAQLVTLYPTHDDYVRDVTASATQAEQAGFLSSADVPLIEQEAQGAPVPQ
jgi:hypothetical protein